MARRRGRLYSHPLPSCPLPMNTKASQRLVGFLVRFLVFAGLWWVLAEGRLHDPWLAATGVTVAAAAAMVVRPLEGCTVHLAGAAAFVPFFLDRALRGGIDVAYRALHPRMPLDPGFIEHPLRHSRARTLLLAWTVSLLPGTAAVRIEGDVLQVHVLDRRQPVRRSLEELEKRLNRICD
ncbi:MAG: cation transporter [Puniceicoccaceae bacterium]|nr:MAG: cation transporter [Puniceicoccaceae bacterium]